MMQLIILIQIILSKVDVVASSFDDQKLPWKCSKQEFTHNMKQKSLFVMLKDNQFHELFSIDGYLMSDILFKLRNDYKPMDRCTDHIEPDQSSNVDTIKMLPCIEQMLINQFPLTYKRYTHNEISPTSIIVYKDEYNNQFDNKFNWTNDNYISNQECTQTFEYEDMIFGNQNTPPILHTHPRILSKRKQLDDFQKNTSDMFKKSSSIALMIEDEINGEIKQFKSNSHKPEINLSDEDRREIERLKRIERKMHLKNEEKFRKAQYLKKEISMWKNLDIYLIIAIVVLAIIAIRMYYGDPFKNNQNDKQQDNVMMNNF